MKRIKQICLMLLAFTLLFGAFTYSQDVNASSYKPNYIKHFPKSISGTWYAYTNFGYGKKKIHKMTLSAKSLNFHPYKKHKVFIGDTSKLSAKEKKYFDKTSKWSYGSKFKEYGYNWFNFYGWQQSAGDGDFYNVHTFNHHEVLSLAGGAGIWVSAHFYRFKSLALKMGQKHYPNFKYYDDLK